MEIRIIVDDATERRLKYAAIETGRALEDLATCAVEEAALDFFRYRDGDPGKIVKLNEEPTP